MVPLPPLPIDAALDEIITHLQAHNALVVLAAPGAGKTTRIAPAILAAQILPKENPGVIVLQPRRIATRAVAARIATENHWSLGGVVGYQVRMESCIGEQTRLFIMTEGILNRRLQSDPALDGIGAVILDEFHQRTVHIDQALAMLRDVQAHLRPELKLLIASATLDPHPIAAFLDNCPVIEVPGRSFPVQIISLPAGDRPLHRHLADAMEKGLALAPPGHTLIFLPGAYEINAAARSLAPLARKWNMLLLPLHGSLPLAQQAAAINPSDQRKIILATNVAETSITVDGVTLVIDSGLSRQASFDASRGINRLRTGRISQASAHQRAGRAGRTGPGICIRLWHPDTFRHQPAADPPEITQIDLASLCLDVYRWNPAGFDALPWLTPPPAAGVQSAKKLLWMLGAAFGEKPPFALTPMGIRMADLPLHPRLSQMVISGIQRGLGPWAIMLAVVISERDIPLLSDTAPTSWNIYTRLEKMVKIIRTPANTSHSAGRELHALLNSHRRLCGQLNQPNRLPELPAESIISGLLLGSFPDRVCICDARDPSRAVMAGGVGVQLGAGASHGESTVLIALDVQKNADHQKLATIRLAARLTIEQLLSSASPLLTTTKAVTWNSERRSVTAAVETRFSDLLIKTHRDPAPDFAAARQIAAENLRDLCQSLIASEPEVGSLCHRVRLLRKYMGPGAAPEVSAESMAAFLADFITRDELRPLPEASQLASLILQTWLADSKRLLETLLPTRWVLAGGKNAVLQYTQDGPVLTARLGDLLGTRQSPKILGGRVAVVCEILGPNFRPVQITADLEGFWRGSYHQIRKDLRARYPRHPWPEDPLTYVPQPRVPGAKRGRK